MNSGECAKNQHIWQRIRCISLAKPHNVLRVQVTIALSLLSQYFLKMNTLCTLDYTLLFSIFFFDCVCVVSELHDVFEMQKQQLSIIYSF